MTEMGDETPATFEMISFVIADQEFCIDIRAVREIRGWTAPNPMPHTPHYVMGVINLRGVVMAVLDLRARLGLGVTSSSARHVYVVVEQQDHVIGLMVDAVQETFVVDADRLQEPPIGSETASLVDAVIDYEGRMLMRLVLDDLLPAAPRLAA